MKKLKKFFITSLSILSISATTVPLVALVSSCSDTSDKFIDPNVFVLNPKLEEAQYERYIIEHNGSKCLMLPEANAYLINLDTTYDTIPEINYIVFPKSNFHLYGSIKINGLESFRGFLWNGNNFSNEPPKSLPKWDKNYKWNYEHDDFYIPIYYLSLTIKDCTLIPNDFKFPTIPIKFRLSIVNSNFKNVDLSNQKKLWLENCWGYLGNLLLPRNLPADLDSENYLVLGLDTDRDALPTISIQNAIFFSGANDSNNIVVPKEIEEFTWRFAGDGKTKFGEISFEKGSKFYIHKNDDPYNHNFQALPINRIIEVFLGYKEFPDPYLIKPSSVMHLNFSNCKYIPREYINEIKKRYGEFKGYIDKLTLPDGSVLYPNNPKLSIIK